MIEKLFIGKATPVIQNGKIISNNLKKLRISVEQLEARLRENGRRWILKMLQSPEEPFPGKSH
ncbi:DUF421 domain-containing protein [Neobacillus sp. OS1-32]|uniref:YetF domain-containing protein n=1 Tax=Neobacillus sp. OS1-32 TaxID=3070682 RepID=UPI0027DEECE7|nr:YetF domain-containing protein [Neobacillus sp. OS1-32]WML28644.1 DUF421 domain-containing protein [Neobacillus sp. OS1-32]